MIPLDAVNVDDIHNINKLGERLWVLATLNNRTEGGGFTKQEGDITRALWDAEIALMKLHGLLKEVV